MAIKAAAAPTSAVVVSIVAVVTSPVALVVALAFGVSFGVGSLAQVNQVQHLLLLCRVYFYYHESKAKG